jgi:DNA-binding PadR family transcriptional regulator
MVQDTPLTDLTAFQRDCLGIIGDMDSPHGLGIKDRLEHLYGKEVHHGRLYPNLDTLVEKGLVEKGSKDRRTNSYEITARGQRELRTHVAWYSDVADSEDKELIA